MRIRQNTKNLPEVTLYTSLGVKKVIGLIDTGNELRDFASDDPVNIIDPRLAESITTHPEWEKGFHMIPYSSIGGDGVMKVFRIEKMCIHMDEDIWIENPLLGMSSSDLHIADRNFFCVFPVHSVSPFSELSYRFIITEEFRKRNSSSSDLLLLLFSFDKYKLIAIFTLC